MWLRKLPYFTRSAVFALFALGLTAFLEASDVFRRIDSDLTITNSVVVADQMQCLVLRVLPIDLTQERKPLDMSMTLLATRDDGFLQCSGFHCLRA